MPAGLAGPGECSKRMVRRIRFYIKRTAPPGRVKLPHQVRIALESAWSGNVLNTVIVPKAVRVPKKSGMPGLRGDSSAGKNHNGSIMGSGLHRIGWDWDTRGSPLCPLAGVYFSGLMFLVQAEEVLRVVLLLDLRQTVIIFAICRANAVFAFFHHEVDVCAARRIRMQVLPIVPRPLRNLIFTGRTGIDTHPSPAPKRRPDSSRASHCS